MTTKKDLQRELGKTTRNREKQSLDLALYLKRLFRRTLNEILDRVDVKNTTVTEAARELKYLETEFIQKGVREILARGAKIYADEAKGVKNQFDALGISFGAMDKSILKNLIKFDFEKVGKIIESTGGSLRQIVTRAVILNKGINVNAVYEHLGSKMESQIRTEINTGASGFNTTVTVDKAKKLFGDNPKFIYVGPYDSVTRPFCQDVLTRRTPPIYTEKEISAMNNNQGLDVISYGGGYNCRHGWFPVSEDLEQEIKGES